MIRTISAGPGFLQQLARTFLQVAPTWQPPRNPGGAALQDGALEETGRTCWHDQYATPESKR